MQILQSSRFLEPGAFGPCALGLGIFDGVHRGHQALLHKVVQLAASDEISSLAYTFNPHPARALNPALAPQLVEPVDVRLERCAALGLTASLVEPFDLSFAATSAERFVIDVLVAKLQARHVVVGSGFTFGARQQGNVALLERLGEEFGFRVHPVDLVKVQGITVSSTKIREFVREGVFSGAKLLLGRPFSLSGVVMRGAERGSRIGFPTANIETHNELIPGLGVYPCVVKGSFGRFEGVANIGVNPTFGDARGVKIEAHLFEYRGGNLYGEIVSIEFLDKLRAEKRFESIEALTTQIAEDVRAAKMRLASESNH